MRQSHIPFRRDCRLCLEEMGQDLPHRRRKKEKGDAAYVMSVDVAGPFTTGWDYTEDHGKHATLFSPQSRYQLLTLRAQDVEAGGAEDVEGLDEFAADEVEIKALQTTKRFEDEILRKQAAEAGEPVEVQNLTIMEPLPSRQACEARCLPSSGQWVFQHFVYTVIGPRSCCQPRWKYGQIGIDWFRL